MRQLRDSKGSIETSELDAEGMLTNARICGAVLASAHAGEGDAPTITGNLGDGPESDKAIGAFAAAYGAISEHDHAELLAATSLSG